MHHYVINNLTRSDGVERHLHRNGKPKEPNVHLRVYGVVSA